MRFLRDQGLAITMFGIFAVAMVGLVLTGWNNYNGEQIEHSMQTITLAQYLTTPSFGEAVFENWESEFLQMGGYVLLTAFLSSEAPRNQRTRTPTRRPRTLIPAKRLGSRSPGRFAPAAYARSLRALARVGAVRCIFVVSFVLHAVTGAGEYSEELLDHGGRAVSALEYLGTARFWFESFQNWQSEFLAVGALIVLSIVLRQRGSPESKPVAASHRATGS